MLRWGEGVSSPQVVRKPPQATGTLPSHQRASRSLLTTAFGFIVDFLPSKNITNMERSDFILVLFLEEMIYLD